MRHDVPCVLMLLSVFWLSGCGVTQQEAGKTVDLRRGEFCQWAELPAKCDIPTDNFTFQFSVTPLPCGEYEIDGEAIVAEADTTLNTIGRGIFSFHLIDRGTIVETVTFNPSGSLWDAVPFRKVFMTEQEFEAIGVSYRVTIPL